MSFQDMMRDNITIIKTDGKELGKFKADVQGEKIYLMGSEVLIEPGDSVRRAMTNGGSETYKVIDPGFQEGIPGIPSHYKMKVEKNNLPKTNQPALHQTNHFYAEHSRVNNNSLDNSLNISRNNDKDLLKQIELLRMEVKRELSSFQEKQDANEVIDAIQAQIQKEKPKKTVIQALLSGLPHAGNIASIGSLLVSMLSRVS